MKRREFLIKGAMIAGNVVAYSLMPLADKANANVSGLPMAGRQAVLPWVVKPTAPGRVQAFDLADVTLLPSLFQAARDRDTAYLLSLEPDRFLHNFRKEAGLTPKAPIYGGWENSGVAGHILGHYLSALSMEYRATHDPRIKMRVAYIVGELALCQEKNGHGYVSA